MKAVGLIVEYNPLHNGHLHHIEQARVKSNAEVVIAVMSGNFLQRGEPAIVDKFTRAKMAVKQNVDIVIELPIVYTIQHSDIFAFAAIQILNKFQVTDIIFGSEHGDIQAFNLIWQEINCNKQKYQAVLTEQLKQGNNYPQANKVAIEAVCSSSPIDLHKPNNILGFSYLKAQKKINPKIKLDTIKRVQADYHQTQVSQPISSATSIRNQLEQFRMINSYKELSMPLTSYSLLGDYQDISGVFHRWELYYPFLKYRILSDSIEQLRLINGMTEGLEYRLKAKIVESKSFAEFIEKVQTKRYTKTRLQRLFIHILLQLTKQQVNDQLKQIDQINAFRLLAMTNQGQGYLNQLKKKTDLKMITQLKKNLSDRFVIDEKASLIYYLPLNPESQLFLRKQEFSPPFIMSKD
ncbi:nucleotidyltransferase [Amphibacillus sp. MSJ-3]|uniref:nucleotidyltransferase n=1 Tax=Amphibacillus sp. MSJ-3 TaxID=2841505 RepID=UPI001C0E9910|nr:nucleotidyltransferase [Amphibacillus sp. MSJ-3]